MGNSKVNSSGITNKKKPVSFGWLVLLGPLTIVVFLTIFHGLPWIAEETKRGAHAEALTSNSMGMEAMNQGRYDEAYKQFMTALHIKPDYAEPMMNLGILYHLKGNNNAAITYLQRAISLNPKKKNMIYNNLGMVYADESQLDTALVMFKTALELGVRPAPIWRNIGQIEFQRENWDGVIEAYQNAIANSPSLINLYKDMLQEALYSENNEDYVDQVRELLKNGIGESEVAPYDSLIVNMFLGVNEKLAEDYKDLAIGHEKSEKLSEAVQHFRKALEITPGWSAIHNRIGILYAKNKMWDEAEQAFLEALEANPNDGEARSNLKYLRSQKSKSVYREIED